MEKKENNIHDTCLYNSIVLEQEFTKLKSELKEEISKHTKREIRKMWIVFGTILTIMSSLIIVIFNQTISNTRDVVQVKERQMFIQADMQANITKAFDVINLKVNLVLATVKNDKDKVEDITERLINIQSQPMFTNGGERGITIKNGR